MVSKRLYDFKCPRGHVSEHLVYPDVKHVFCPVCGLNADRLIPAVRSALEGISGHFPDATRKWERLHVEGARQARERRLKDEGPDAS